MPNPLLMPCPHVSPCFPCNVLPTTNKSSETEDVIEFFSTQWGNIQNNTPPLGRLFTANGCVAICASPISQDEAFLCAQRQQAFCVINNWQPTPPEDPVCLNFPCAPTTPPTEPPAETFGNDPESCRAFCPDGTPFTFTVPAGSFVADNPTLANRMASSYACRQAPLHRICLTLASPYCCLDNSSSLAFSVTGMATSPDMNFWQITNGSLPPGMTFDPVFAGPLLVISGTPTALSDYPITMRVTAPSGDFMERPFTIIVAGITNADPLADAQIGTPYSEQLVASGLGADLNWAVVDGALPPDLELDLITGEISGDVTTAGDYEFTISVSNGLVTCRKDFTITVVEGCFIDASPNGNLSAFNQVIARAGGIAVFNDFSGPLDGWYYLAHQFNLNPLTLGGSDVINYVCASGRYIAGSEFTPDSTFWIDLDTLTIRNVMPNVNNTPVGFMNASGDFALDGTGAFIYNATTNTLSADLFASNTFHIYQINNSRDSVGIKPVAGQNHCFRRTAAGAYVDLHPFAGGFSNPGGGGFSGTYFPVINSAGHVVGSYNGNRIFANFGGASIFLSGIIVLGNAIINDDDQVAWADGGTGHVFIYDSGNTDIGNVGFLAGFNNNGIAVGMNFAQTNAWIYSNGVVSNLISKIPCAAAAGWTSLKTIFDISDDNIVTGIGVKGGVDTIFVAKVSV